MSPVAGRIAMMVSVKRLSPFRSSGVHGDGGGVCGPGGPGPAAARARRVVRPRVGARLAWPRHGVAPPQPAAAVGVVALDVPAPAELRPGAADDDDAVGDARRAGHRNTVLELRGADVPDLLAGLLIERLNAPVEDRPVEPAVFGD